MTIKIYSDHPEYKVTPKTYADNQNKQPSVYVSVKCKRERKRKYNELPKKRNIALQSFPHDMDLKNKRLLKHQIHQTKYTHTKMSIHLKKLKKVTALTGPERNSTTGPNMRPTDKSKTFFFFLGVLRTEHGS